MKRKFYQHLNKSWKAYTALLVIGLVTSKADASAIERMTNSTTSITSLVKGPLGEVSLVVASIGGAFAAFMKGNMWLCIGIFMVGMLFSWHLENIAGMFPGGR